jgi:DNA polymerase-3 subunit alpha (Gram-positive type)
MSKTIQDSYNTVARGHRQIIIDTETTGLVGAHLVSIGLLEMVDGKLTDRSLYTVVNPGVIMDQRVIDIHHITNEMAKECPPFSVVAKQVRDFIGDSQVVITCRTKDNYTLDIGVLNMELQKAKLPQIPAKQWLNVRRWSEEMYGTDGARLDAVLDRFGVSRAQREAEGHGSLLDAELLAEVYPKLAAAYKEFKKTAPVSKTQPKP